MSRVGNAIKKYRLIRNITIKELSDRVGVAASNLSAIEKGDRNPKPEMCCKIANILDADPVEISGIELSETDEIRLLIKLLNKYILDISSYEVYNEVDENAGIHVNAVLSKQLESYYDVYSICMKNILDILSTKKVRSSETSKAIAEQYEIVEYFIDTFPKYDINDKFPDENAPELTRNEMKSKLYEDLIEDFKNYKKSRNNG